MKEKSSPWPLKRVGVGAPRRHRDPVDRRAPLSHFTLSHAALAGDLTPAFGYTWARDPRRLVRTRPWSLQAASPSLHGLIFGGSRLSGLSN